MSIGDAQGHRRTTTEEQIALAIANTTDPSIVAADKRQVGIGEWACLQCTFINPPNGQSCAMCMCPRPAPSEEDMVREQGSRNSIRVAGMYGNQPPPAASQPSKRSLPKASFSASQHRRMTTEEQITLAIEQSIEAKIDEPVEMFERKPVEMFNIAEKKQDEAQHRRMTTEEQINRAIQMSSNDMGDADFPTEKQDGGSDTAHRRMTTEEQISKAITQSTEPEEAEMTDLDLINAAIENAGIVHRRWSTEDMNEQAVNKPEKNESTEKENFVVAAGGVGQIPIPSEFMESYIQDILENPVNYENQFAPPPGLFFGPRERGLVQRFIKALNENKQEINKTRLSLNKERRNNQDLKYEYEILSNECAKLEQDLQQAQEEVEAATTQKKELENRLDEKAEDLEDTFENNTASQEKEPHRREASYAGIGELFARDQEVETEKQPLAEQVDHGRKPSYRGVQEMFQDQKTTDWEDDQEKKNQEQENPQQKSEETGHGQQASYGGISAMFTKTDENTNADGTTEMRSTAAPKGRAPSYGGIREMFMDDDDTMDGYDEDAEKDKKHERDASYGAVQFELTENVDQEASKEEEENELGNTLEENIYASFDVVWKLLVEKVHHPEKYLPVEDVAVEHQNGKWIRHMFLTPMEIVITEEIQIDPEEFTIKFVDHNFPDLEIVNILERTEDPNKQRIIFYKQNRETNLKVASERLFQMFRTDIHFLKRRAAQKMSRAAHEREPSYGGVTQYAEQMGASHARDTSYGGVGDLITTAENHAPNKSRHVSKMSYGGIRTMFDQNESRQLMVRLQEEVFRVMDMHPWSEITKGMVVQEVEEALGFELESFHKRFIKITIMRIIDGKLKLECFAGENAKNMVVGAEQKGGNSHNRDISYGGVQQMFDDENDWKRKENELDDLYTKTQDRELDRLYNKAQSASAEAIQTGGFKAKRKKREQEKETVRKTRKHSRNVSYGGVRYMDTSKVEEEVEAGPEVVRVAGTVHSRNASNQYFTLGGFEEKKQGQNVEALTEEIVLLRQENVQLLQQNEDLRNSKMQLVQTCSGEMERLRSLLHPSVKS